MAPERNIVVERAEETNSLLAAIVECSADAIVGEGLNGKITYWNGAAERLFGFASHEAVGRPGHFFAPRESIHAEAELRTRVTQGETVDPFDAVRVCKDGSTVEVSVAISPIKDASGRITGASRIMREISARKATERAQRRRKKMEETLRESEERFRTLADNIAQLAWMADGKGYIFWYNKRWFEYTGTTLEEMQGWGWQKAHHPDHVKRVVEKIRHAFATGEYWEDTFPLRNKEGDYRWFLSRAIPIRNSQGVVVRWIGTNTDITDQKHAEETLRESEERFRTLADNIAQIAWMADRTGSVFWINKRWGEITGTTLEDVQGWGWQRLHHPDHVDRVVAKIREAVETGRSWEEIFQLRCKDGAYRWFLSRGAPIRNEQQQVLRWLGTSTDITGRLEAEKALAAARDRAEESERLFRAFVTASSDVVYRLNADWTVMRRLEGKHFIADTHDPNRGWVKKYIHPDDQPRVLAAIDEAILEKKAFELEHRVILVDGKLGWTFSRAIPLFDERGEITEWFGAAHDITERKQAEEALQRLTENLERMVGDRTAQLLETVGELEAFSYSIAHDMRAPLRSLQGYAEVLLAEHSDRLEPEGQEYLKRIGTAANRMDRLILDVLNYSRIVRSELKPERVQLGSLIDDIMKTYPMLAPDKADVEVSRPLPTVLGNDAMLTQVFSNLLGNAVKFAPPGVKPRIRVWSESRGPHVRVLVQDSGIGIAADQHQKIFEVFQQADTTYGGTGIGLAIVKKAIERIGGQVGLWSEPGKGSTFWVEIPRAD